jgi:hypothetical protein
VNGGSADADLSGMTRRTASDTAKEGQPRSRLPGGCEPRRHRQAILESWERWEPLPFPTVVEPDTVDPGVTWTDDVHLTWSGMFNLTARRIDSIRVRATLKWHRPTAITSGVLWIRRSKVRILPRQPAPRPVEFVEWRSPASSGLSRCGHPSGPTLSGPDVMRAESF